MIPGDFNETVRSILDAGTIGEKTATFALLDQRTFECEWRTVVALSKHKRETKIELFYFFPTGWIDRSLGAVRVDSTIAKVERWWGRNDWAALQGMDGFAPNWSQRDLKMNWAMEKRTYTPFIANDAVGELCIT